MAQALVHGARLLQVDGNFDDCLELARKLAVDYPVALVNSVNPDRIEGQKTAAFEICDVLGRAPDIHCIPVGNAGNITAYWKGYTEYFADGLIAAPPAHVRIPGGRRGADRARAPRSLKPKTIATAIRIGNPASWTQAETARDDESGGLIDSVTDKQILEAYRLLARNEAVFVEPASAASVAGLHQVRTRRPGTQRRAGGVHGDRQRAQGPGMGHRGSTRAGHRSRWTGGRPRSSSAWRDGAVRHRPASRSGAGDQRQPRPGFRQLRARARALRPGAGRGPSRGVGRRGAGRGCDDGAPRRATPAGARRIAPRSTASGASRRGWRCTVATRSRTGAGSGPRPRPSWPASRSRAVWSPTAHSGSTTRRRSRWPTISKDTPTTSRPVCSAA